MSATIIYLLIGAGALYWLFMMGGKEQLAGMLNDMGMGSIFGGASGATSTNTGKNSWTDENNNNFNIESDVRTASNVSGGACAAGIQGNVQSMLQKMGVNMNGSRQNISRSSQIDTTGEPKQSQTRSQR